MSRQSYAYTLRTCDRCKVTEDQKDAGAEGWARVSAQSSGGGSLGHDWTYDGYSSDLCQRCAEEFKQFMGAVK